MLILQSRYDCQQQKSVLYENSILVKHGPFSFEFVFLYTLKYFYAALLIVSTDTFSIVALRSYNMLKAVNAVRKPT